MFELYLLLSVGFFFYSYTHVDLNLTLTTFKPVNQFINKLQRLAYFHRPLSTKIYLAFSFLFLAIFLYITLKKANKLKKFPWKWVIAITGIFAFAYPFLSHDIFNYVFYAKTIIKYGKSPYVAAPNWFPQDPWLRFMRWTHVPSPYGPFHALIVLPSYILGLGKLTLSLFWIKVINFSFFLLSIKYIGKIARLLKRSRTQVIKAQLLLALNPLILFESLANGHNDAVMMAIYLFALYFLLKSQKVKSFLILLVSIGVKYITALLTPMYFLTKKLSKETLVNLQIALFAISVIFFYVYYGFQVWYSTWALYVAPLSKSKALRNAVLLFSLGGILYYVPYIRTGLWEQQPIYTKTIMFAIPLAYFLLHSTLNLIKKNTNFL